MSAVITRDGFTLPGTEAFPEGIAVDGEGNFFIGSVANGSIFRVSLDEGTVSTPFDTAGLVAVVGMNIQDDVLWACHSDPAMGSVAQVIGFEIATGTELVRHNFPSEDATLTNGSGFCNDISFDGAGNLYATDSFGDAATNLAGSRESRILRVAAADLLTANSAAVWLTAPEFSVDAADFGLNGIDVDTAGDRVFAVRSAGGVIYEIPIETDGSAGTLATLATTGPALEQGDGLKFVPDPTSPSLLLIQSSTLTRVELPGGNATPVFDELADEFLTTFALFGGAAWIVEGQLNHFFAGTDPDLPFRVVRVPLP